MDMISFKYCKNKLIKKKAVLLCDLKTHFSGNIWHSNISKCILSIFIFLLPSDVAVIFMGNSHLMTGVHLWKLQQNMQWSKNKEQVSCRVWFLPAASQSNVNLNPGNFSWIYGHWNLLLLQWNNIAQATLNDVWL